ncbi:mycofactocin-coupled SDR family oxidoreductase [Rhodococcus sp. C26F]|uniref:Mycofactocin-coupled SDR family oxidoreductase n=2 Tax=Rhodococcus TaxID=1827 RepID=A0AA47AA43_RHORH|nr:mycofactocin-coupled SDR family oxidoreductase [Rhodococcus rhodochrous]MCB8914037.1 mycofactocin-coupled SDR family oxidoreductase [Rhodococcus rhodochrous]UZF48024.1 mycofactocin-coupled SDR family oxidoreductase [Rhodococcus rhodochrous]
MVLLENKVAFITGAARGQGRNHAVRFAQQGADIIAFDICASASDDTGYPPSTPEDLVETARLVRAEGRDILTMVGDVRKQAALQAAVEAGVERFGRLDVVVANAGISTWNRFWEMPEEQWTTMIDINLNGVWRTLTASVPAMIQGGRGGSIVVVSSAAGIKAGPGASHYTSAKHGLVGLTKTAAIELGEFGIRVNSVHPGAVDTPMGQDTNVGRLLAQHPRYVDSYKWPLAGLSKSSVDDITDAVLYLASDRARTITGSQLVLDLGITTI